MNMWKLFTFAAIFALAFTACDGGGSDPEGDPAPEPCSCTVKVHPYGEPCDCGAADCDCTMAEMPKSFTIVVDEKTVTIKDGRTGDIAQSLEELGVISTIEGLFTEVTGPDMNKVLGRGLTIVVEAKDETYGTSWCKAYNGNTSGFDFETISNTFGSLTYVQLIGLFNNAIVSMAELPDPNAP